MAVGGDPDPGSTSRQLADHSGAGKGLARAWGALEGQDAELSLAGNAQRGIKSGFTGPSKGLTVQSRRFPQEQGPGRSVSPCPGDSVVSHVLGEAHQRFLVRFGWNQVVGEHRFGMGISEGCRLGNLHRAGLRVEGHQVAQAVPSWHPQSSPPRSEVS